MSVEKAIISVGFDKNGDADFGVVCSVIDLTFVQMQELRAMIPVAIGQMERMWGDARSGRACESAGSGQGEAPWNWK